MMTQPPRGSKMMPSKALDARDAEILARLAADERCQARVLTDRGQHYIFCGGYFGGKATPTPRGLRCSHHKTW